MTTQEALALLMKHQHHMARQGALVGADIGRAIATMQVQVADIPKVVRSLVEGHPMLETMSQDLQADRGPIMEANAILYENPRQFLVETWVFSMVAVLTKMAQGADVMTASMEAMMGVDDAEATKPAPSRVEG